MTKLLVDGNGVAVRTWWASPHDVVPRFKAAIERVVPTSGAEVIVCWDQGPSWRQKLYPQYKANRPPKPEALKKALHECALNCGGLIAKGYEADDIIATLARDGQDGVVLVLSDDKDLLQLVAPKRIVIGGNSAIYDHRISVEKKLGVGPERIRHLLSWMGDKADGLPGVLGYGKKKAIAKALAGEIGNQVTYELTELATVPRDLMERV